MSTSHAGINELYILWFQLCIFFTNLSKLCLYFRLLLCFFQIILPLTLQICIRVSFYPQSSQTILYHVAYNPVRCKKLRNSRNFLFCNLSFFRKGIILWLSIIILIHPADDFYLSSCADVKIFLQNIMYQMIHNSILINYRQI